MTVTYEKSVAGFYRFDAPSQSGWINKKGRIWEVQADTIGHDGKMIISCRRGYGWTLAEAKEVVERIFG